MNAYNNPCKKQNPLRNETDETIEIQEEPSLFSVSENFCKIRSMLHFLNYAYSNHSNEHCAPMTDTERLGGFFVFNSLTEEIKKLEKDCLFLIKNQ